MLKLSTLSEKLKTPKYWLVTGLVVLLVTTFMASGQMLGQTETDFLKAIYGWPSLLRPLFLLITWTGSIWMAIGLAIYFWWRKNKTQTFNVAFVSAVTYILAMVLKLMVARPRPEFILSGIVPRELFVSGHYGFPSGHAALSVVLALTLYKELKPHWRRYILFWPLLVGLSRIYLGVHAPLDVIGGWSLGLAIVGFLGFGLTSEGFAIFTSRRKLNYASTNSIKKGKK